MLNMEKNKENLGRRILVLIFGNIFISAGIALLETAAFGNDPHSAMMLTIAEKTGTNFQICFYAASALYFLIEFLTARDLIGIGTFINWFLVGYFTNFFLALMERIVASPSMLVRVIFIIAGLIITSLGISMYQCSRLGVGPYDSLALILDRKLPGHYFWVRILVDGTCAAVAVALGSFGTHVGAGTLITAFGLGPVISFFNVHVSAKLVGKMV